MIGLRRRRVSITGIADFADSESRLLGESSKWGIFPGDLIVKYLIFR
jgi:hypothetical protein